MKYDIGVISTAILGKCRKCGGRVCDFHFPMVPKCLKCGEEISPADDYVHYSDSFWKTGPSRVKRVIGLEEYNPKVT